MKTRAELVRLADAMDFRPEPVEKVHRLLAILGRLKGHELSHGKWVLKGGSAINLFHLNVPRLSMEQWEYWEHRLNHRDPIRQLAGLRSLANACKSTSNW